MNQRPNTTEPMTIPIPMMPDDQHTCDCSTLDAFLAEIQARRLGTVILAWQQEYAQDVQAPGVVYDRLAKTTCLAYDKATGSVVRCTLAGAEAAREPLRLRLAGLGLRVEERSRNLG